MMRMYENTNYLFRKSFPESSDLRSITNQIKILQRQFILE